MSVITQTSADGFDQICQTIGYTFQKQELLALALTHSSVKAGRDPAKSNERLEFLGDRVLGLAVAEMLHERFPSEAEGDVAKRFTGLVRQETLAEIANELGWERFIIVDRGERGPNGLEESILADAIEALIAAIHLDGGWNAAKSFIRRYWSDRLDIVKTPTKDAKTRLQEWVQSRGNGLPIYKEVDRHGPAHAPVFTVEVTIDGKEEPVRGLGRSKRIAEQAAATQMLAEIGITEGIFPTR